MSNRQKSKPRLNPGCLGKFAGAGAGAGAPVFKEEPGFAGAGAPAFKEEPGFAGPGPRSSKNSRGLPGPGPRPSKSNRGLPGPGPGPGPRSITTFWDVSLKIYSRFPSTLRELGRATD